MDSIGIFKGKKISEMSREELLDFAKWAGARIYELEMKTKDLRLDSSFISKEYVE